MASFKTYSAIVSSVQEVAENDGAEFLAYIPKAIELAQMRMQDEVDSQELNSVVEVTCTPSNRLVLKPENYRFTNNMFVVTSGGREEPLTKASASYLRDYWPVATNTDVPEYYATDYEEAYFLLAPTPASAYVLRTDIQQDIAFVSVSNPSNIFTEKYGNALFYATMKEMMVFEKNYAAAQDFDQMYQSTMPSINNRGRRDRRQDGGSNTLSQSGQNTLLGTN
jgi:hypothetical protein